MRGSEGLPSKPEAYTSFIMNLIVISFKKKHSHIPI